MRRRPDPATMSAFDLTAPSSSDVVLANNRKSIGQALCKLARLVADVARAHGMLESLEYRQAINSVNALTNAVARLCDAAGRSDVTRW